MLIKNAKSWAPHTLSNYGYALAGVGIAFFIRYQFHPLMQSSFPILFFLFNTLLIAFKFGWRPATFSAILGIALAYYFFIPPYNSFDLENLMDAVYIAIYALLFFVAIYLIEKLQRERYRAVLIARVCESRMEIMAKMSSKKRTSG